MSHLPTCRRATNGDLEGLVALLGELFAIEADFEADSARQRRGLDLLLADERQCVMVAEEDGSVVGMCTAQRVISTAEGGEAAWVEDVVVRVGCRGRGIGRTLLTAIEVWAREQGITRLQLVADRENTPALRFYEALGWKATQLVCLRRSLPRQREPPEDA